MYFLTIAPLIFIRTYVSLQMVFGNCGVLTEMGPSKSYVEMTGIDAETSQDIAEVTIYFQSLL